MPAMNPKQRAHDAPGGRVALLCARRTVLAGAGLGLTAIFAPARAIAGDSADAAEDGNSRAGVRESGLAFFADRPMIDPSGRLPVYRAPNGLRGAGPLARMDQRARRALDPFMPG